MTAHTPDDNLREQILETEKLSRVLEPSPESRREPAEKLIDYAENFLNNIDTIKTYQVSEEKGRGLFDSPITEEGIDIEQAISLIAENVDKPGLNPASGGHLAYIPGRRYLLFGACRLSGRCFQSLCRCVLREPGAVRMENMLIRWMNDLVGYPARRSGNLTTSGSLANMIAVVVARDAKGIKAADIPRSVIYLSKQAHHSIDKGDPRCGSGRVHPAICPDRRKIQDRCRPRSKNRSRRIKRPD